MGGVREWAAGVVCGGICASAVPAPTNARFNGCCDGLRGANDLLRCAARVGPYQVSPMGTGGKSDEVLAIRAALTS